MIAMMSNLKEKIPRAIIMRMRQTLLSGNLIIKMKERKIKRRIEEKTRILHPGLPQNQMKKIGKKAVSNNKKKNLLTRNRNQKTLMMKKMMKKKKKKVVLKKQEKII